MFSVVDKIKARIGGSDSRTVNVIRNTIAVSLMKIASLLCSLLIVPITIDYLSPENYGIWMAITSILYWFAFFDVGLGNGMRNYLAEALSNGDWEKARSYFSTAIFMLTGIALLIGIIAVPVIYCFDLNYVFNAHNISGRYLASVLTIAVVLSLVQFVVKTIGMVYIAMQKYAVNDFIIFIGNVISISLIYVLTRTTESSLAYVVLVFTGIPVLIFILAAIPLIRNHSQLFPNRASIDYATAKKITTKGLGFFVIQITSCLVIFGSANIFISHFCGPTQVTVYNVAYKLFNVLVIGYTITISPLWSAYTDAAVNDDYQWIRRAFKKSFLMWVLSVIAGVVLLFLSKFLYRLWIGGDLDIPYSVSLCVLAYICVFNLNNCVTYLINGLNKIRVQIITSVIATLVYLILIVVVNNRFGIIGISLSMAIVYFFMAIVHLYQCRLLINKKANGIWNK